MKHKIKKFFKNNLIVFLYLFFVLFTELLSISFVDCIPLLTKPLYPLLLLGVVLSVLFLFKSAKIKAILCCLLLVVQIIFNIGFVYLYDSNGTYFEWAMMNQRNDAFGTIEDLSLRWGLLAILCVEMLLFIIAIILIFKFYYKDEYKNKTHVATKSIIASILAICSIFLVVLPIISAVNYSKMSYVDRYLYSDATNKYQQLGITSNAIYEFFNGTIAENLVKHDDKGIEKFIYEDENPLLETSEYFGISKNNNLVYILVESFEWYAFLENCTPEQSAVLYPNLNKFLSDSVYSNNFYAREKTDTSEMLALIGSNPTGKYINYGFEKNTLSWSLPNMFKNQVKKNGNDLIQIKSFHQNTGSFYNRNTLHESLGFEELVDIYDMEKEGLVNTWEGEEKERTLDSKTVEVMKEKMFPVTNEKQQYMTFWITFSSHGFYKERKIFKEQGYYDKLDQVGAYPGGSTKADYLRTYAAAVMDFDKAVGIMMEKLQQNGDLENTTIVMFSDHNTYYNNLSYYAKDIDERFNSELYRIPFMIYDQKLKEAYTLNEGDNVITKFTTTSDLIPTIFDIFGIKGYKNLYFGNSVFVKDVESVIFSRAYGIFITDKLICYGANNLIYKSKDYTKQDYKSFLNRAEILLNKLEMLDKIYYNDWFKNNQLKEIL